LARAEGAIAPIVGHRLPPVHARFADARGRLSVASQVESYWSFVLVYTVLTRSPLAIHACADDADHHLVHSLARPA
jgi:hypothetical protein